MSLRRVSLALLVGTAAFALGCGSAVTPAPDASSADAGNVPTYWRDIAPIVNANCIACHTAGGIAPMPLTTYAEVRPVARLVAQETGAHIMPPWPPASDGCRALQNPRVLTTTQLDAISQWATHGTPEGNQADYVAPMTPEVQHPLPPMGDLVVQPTETYLPNQALTDDYHCFVMDPNLTATTDVIGLRVTPGNARIVHHVILFEVRSDSLAELQRLDDAEPGPGYTCFGSSGITPHVTAPTPGSGDIAEFNTQMIGGWAPGGIPGYLPAHTGIRLKPGSRLVMQVHYNLNDATRGMSDQSRVDLYTSPMPVDSQAIWVPMVDASFSVPPGAGPSDPGGTSITSAPSQYNFRIFGMQPHMHTRGRQIRVDVLHHAGTSDCLVNIPNWNFHWQQPYWFTSPFRPNTASGTADSFQLTCSWDNTAANQPVVNGAPVAPHQLHWGESTSDEMCINFFYAAL